MDLFKLLQDWKLLIFIAFCTFSLILVFYYLFFFLRLGIYKKKEIESSTTKPVSVVVCARDEANNLIKNLPGLLLQQYPYTHEVILVNDNSFDDTKYILEEFQREFKQLHMVELTQEAKMIPGKKFPLSIGIKTAKYETLLLTDADCAPASEFWIDSMQAAYEHNTEIVLGYGKYYRRPGLLNKLIRFETFHTALQYLSYALAKIPYMGVGRNLSYKKEIFFRHKGFSSHNHVPGGDDDLFINTAANKKNTTINIDPNSFTLSEPAKSWGQWIAQKSRHYTTSKYYKGKHKFLLGLYAFSQGIFFPLFITSLLLFDWRLVLGIFGAKVLLQTTVFVLAMKKLKEQDLWPFALLFDLVIFVYYLLFLPALFKKPRPTWK